MTTHPQPIAPEDIKREPAPKVVASDELGRGDHVVQLVDVPGAKVEEDVYDEDDIDGILPPVPERTGESQCRKGSVRASGNQCRSESGSQGGGESKRGGRRYVIVAIGK